MVFYDSYQALINAGGGGMRGLARGCFQVFGGQNAMQGIAPHGKTDPAIAREILRVRLERNPSELNGDIQSVLERYLFFLKDEVQTSGNYRVLPGINSLLDEVSTRDDVILGLATGNVE